MASVISAGKAQARAGAEQDHRRQHVGHVVAVDRRLREHGESSEDQPEAGEQRRPRAEAHDQPSQ
jgi:hypothetical protein